MNDYSLLKKLKRKKKLYFDSVSKLEQNSLIRLSKSEHVEYEISEKDNRYVYTITGLGENYIREERKVFFFWAITTVISLFSLLLGLLTLWLQLQ